MNIESTPRQIEEQQSWAQVAQTDIPACRALGLRIHRQVDALGRVVIWAAHDLHVDRYHAHGGKWEYSA